MKNILLLQICLLFGIASLYAENKEVKLNETVAETEAEQITLSEESKKALKKLKEAIESPYKNKDIYDVKKLASQYKKYKYSVEKLGKLITKEQAASINKMEEISLDYALAAMAYNVTADPRILEELFEFYKENNGPPYKHVSLPPPLEDMHCIEKYHSAWKYLFLAPLGDKRVRFIEDLFTDALFISNNIHSVPILYYNFTLNKAWSGFKCSAHGTMLFSISGFPSPTSLNYLLKGLSLCRDGSTGTFLKANYSGTYKQVIVIIMSGANNQGAKIKHDTTKWKTVISEYPKDNLPAWQKEFLDQVLEAIEKQKKIDAQNKIKEAKETEERLKRLKEQFREAFGEKAYKEEYGE